MHVSWQVFTLFFCWPALFFIIFFHVHAQIENKGGERGGGAGVVFYKMHPANGASATSQTEAGM